MPERGGPQLIPRPAVWSAGRPAPWAGLDAAKRIITPDRARELFPPDLRGLPSPVAAEGGTPSAVLVPLYDHDDGLHVVLTRRAWTLRTHRGEIAFPGGRAEPGEDARTTALREAGEEVDLDPSVVEPLGQLDHLTTVTRRAYIVPVLGLLDRRPSLRPNDGEVDQVLHVPLRELLRDDVFREERWGTPELSRPVYFFELVGDTVWGATAAMLRQMLARLTGTDPGGPIDTDPARDTSPGFRLTAEEEDSVL